MPHTTSQTFLRELDKKLWTAADRLRSNLDAAVYKHAVLGLIFLKYVSDSGTEILRERGHLARSYKITSTGKLIDDALEAVEKENPNGAERHRLPRRAARRVRAAGRINRKNVPVASVYDRRTLKYRIARRQPNDSRLNRRPPKPRKTSDGRRPTLQLQIDPANLAGLAPAKPSGGDGLIDLIATIPFQHADPRLN